MKDRHLARLCRRAAKNTLYIFGIKYSLKGVHLLQPEKNYIYIANHRSWLDQPSVIAAAPQLLHFLGKEDYFSYPFLKTTLRLFRCVPVKKGQRSELIERLEKCLQDGGSLVLYPEGTRSRDNTFLPFRSGAYVLSAKTGVEIVPLYIHGAYENLPPASSFMMLRPQPIHVEVGEPFVVPSEFLEDPETSGYQEEYIQAFEQSKVQHLALSSQHISEQKSSAAQKGIRS